MKCVACSKDSLTIGEYHVISGKCWRCYMKSLREGIDRPLPFIKLEDPPPPPMRNASYVGPLVAWSFAMLVVGFWIGFEVFSG